MRVMVVERGETSGRLREVAVPMVVYGPGRVRRVYVPRGSGVTRSPLYRLWVDIKTRCTNPKSIGFRYYGGRGITFWPAWAASSDRFIRDVMAAIGLKPGPAYTIDRINNDGHYAPGNLRWATRAEQNRNQRRSRRAP